MRILHSLIASPRVYEFWQAPFAERKLRPLFAHNDMSLVRRVLDVACGPGTNTSHFQSAEYLGVDWNEKYVRYATRRYGRPFLTGDILNLDLSGEGSFDFVLVNSFLHHLRDDEVQVVLEKLKGTLAPNGRIHVLELVMPESRGPARLLSRLDRGGYARPLSAWRQLLSDAFVPEVVEPYTLTGLGVPLWHMVYFKGRLPQ